MIALDTNILIYACDKADPARQKVAPDPISRITGGELPWQVAYEFIAAGSVKPLGSPSLRCKILRECSGHRLAGK